MAERWLRRLRGRLDAEELPEDLWDRARVHAVSGSTEATLVGAPRKLRLRRVALAGVGLLAMAVWVIALLYLQDPIRPVPSAPALDGSGGFSPRLRDPMAIFDPEEPLIIGGREATLEEAKPVVEHSLFRPNTAVDPVVWIGTFRNESGAITHEVGLRYASSLAVTYARWPAGTGDVLTRYQSMAREWDVGYATRIGDHPAWVIPRHARSPGAPPYSVVNITIKGLEVSLAGRMEADNLVALAETLRP